MVVSTIKEKEWGRRQAVSRCRLNEEEMVRGALMGR